MRPGRGELVEPDISSDFARSRVVGTILTGLVLAMVNTLLTIALMSVIFAGELADHLDLGIGIGLAASAVMGLIIGLGSGLAGHFAGVQDASAAILGLAAASVAVTLAEPIRLDTVLAMMIVTSLSTGLLFLAMGRFRLGEIARFVPFPVIGGLLAGTGYLIVIASLDILGGLGEDMRPGLLWPGLALAVGFVISSRRGWSSRIYLILLGVGIVGFHVVLAVAAIDRAEALEMELLLGSFPAGSLWPGLTLDSLARADWSAVLAQVPTLAPIFLIVAVTVLLYLSAVEVETRTDLQIGRELRVTGWANLASGVLGGPPGYLYLADTLVARRLVGGRRGAALVAGIALFAIVLGGGGLIELIPQYVVGGLLLFIGFDFLMAWLWDTRRRMSSLDYFLMVGIVATIAAIGFLPGVLAGLVAAIVLFVVRYSRIDVVKHRVTASEYRSNIERSPAQAEYLAANGAAVLILQLQGFVFFGTASRIITEVHQRLDSGAPLEWVVCDFRLVSGIDSSALVVFERMVLLIEEHGARLVLSGLSELEPQMRAALVGETEGVEIEVDLDHAVARCEDSLLAGAGELAAPTRGLPSSLIDGLSDYLESRSVPAGTHLMVQGADPPGLLLIVSGRATVFLESPESTPIRLRTLLEGTLLGEMSLYLGKPVAASVVTETECELLCLSVESFNRLGRESPPAAADLHLFVARTLAARVSHANRAIQNLRR
ncbi:MAG: SulP family inorganic anion transporter [Acidimicrobiia bacterium]|jgi:SulP family sulfate permease